MQLDKSYEIIRELLQQVALVGRARFDDALKKPANSGYLDPKQRVELIKTFGTIRLAIGRQAGHTDAAIDLAKTFYQDQKVAFVCPCTDFLKKLQSKVGSSENILVRPWNDAESLQKENVRAIFVDPGPHAGSKARDAIYWSAAKAMDAGDNTYYPVLVYFIGS